MRAIAYRLYLVFVVSWFLHVPTRIEALGAIRFDLLLIATIAGLIFVSRGDEVTDNISKTGSIIKLMIVYILITLPLVEWPGSVIRSGFERFVKAAVFFYFTVALIDTEDRLKTFIGVFLGCQAIRVIEPVVLHVMFGYWGSVAHLKTWEFMERLSGAPSDVVNPNGLAFIVLTVFPFMHYLSDVSVGKKIQYFVCAPVLLYALVLTGSRTGMVCFAIVLFGVWMKTKKKALMTVIIVVGGILAAGKMSGDMKDRYLSLVSGDTKNSETVDGRITGMINDFRVVLHRPIFGHGLGTSLEANANYGAYGKIAHNLYAEVAQELGIVGLVIFLFFIRSIIKNFTLKEIKEDISHDKFLYALMNGMQVWIFMNIVFSFASFGLTSYEWYLFGGLSIALRRVALQAMQKNPVSLAARPVDLSWLEATPAIP